MGVYLTVINGLIELDIPVILTVGFGILIGLLTMSKVINYFLTHYRTATFALIIGLVIGSVFVIYPGMPTGLIMWIISIATFVTGLLIAYLLGRIERSEEHTSELQSRGHLVCRLRLEKK